MDNVIIYDAIDGVLNECETVMGGVNNIQGTLANGVVKSVQKGVSKGVFEKTDSEVNVTIPISNININKSVLILVDRGSEISGSSYGRASDSTYILNSNSITIANDSVRTTKQYIVSWQVIEFY